MAKKPVRKPPTLPPVRGPRSNPSIITTTEKGDKPTIIRPATPEIERK